MMPHVYIILQDLHDVSVHGNLPIFIGNCLCDWPFHVHLETILSDKFHQEDGAQGAILSTTLLKAKIDSIGQQVVSELNI